MRKVFESAGLECVTPAVEAPLVELVQHLEKWMMDGTGEGVVLNVGGGSGGLVKWKTATESQGGTPDMLHRLLKKFEELSLHAAPHSTSVTDTPSESVQTTTTTATADVESKVAPQFIDPVIVHTIKVMHKVSTSDCGGNSHTAAKARKQK